MDQFRAAVPPCPRGRPGAEDPEACAEPGPAALPEGRTTQPTMAPTKPITEPLTWQRAFSTSPFSMDPVQDGHARGRIIRTLPELKDFLDRVHIRLCLLKPFCEHPDYPLVESRDLLPSFEPDLTEHPHLPGFSLVALARPLDYFSEIFQYDILHGILGEIGLGAGQACPLEQTVLASNLRAFLDRLPKPLHEEFRKTHGRQDLTDLDLYPEVLPAILHMDRGHVMSTETDGTFVLSGIYASFPSDLDTEIKRFGLRIKKFKVGDNVRYELHRLFVYQFLMELYGFPIVSERRTSAALLARRLHRMGERFLVRVLGQSDRTLTTLWSPGGSGRYPRVEKIALVQVGREQKEVIRRLGRRRAFVDRERRVVILRVVYRQHPFDPANVQQERALSVLRQEVIHPLSGRIIADVNLLKDTTTMFLRLNDIVRGEFLGRIVFKRNEIVVNTDSVEKRLKFLYSWLSKHQRRIIGYSDEFFAKIVKVLDNYLLNPDNYEDFSGLHDLYQEVWSRYSYIQQARKVKLLGDIQQRTFKGRKINYLEMLEMMNQLFHDLKFEIVHYFDTLVQAAIGIGEGVLHDPYLVRSYVPRKEEALSAYGREVRRQYGRLVALLDELKAIRRSRVEVPESRTRTA
jgi:hypothetical protein